MSTREQRAEEFRQLMMRQKDRDDREHEARVNPNPLLAVGRGVVIRDTKGIGEPILGRVVKVTADYALVDVHAADRRLIQFETATLCAMLPGEHERWKLTAPGSPSSEEYGDLLIRQARLQAERDRIRRELDLIAAVLETADVMEAGK